MKSRLKEFMCRDEGASLVLISAAMLLLLGIAAIAVDLAAFRSDLQAARLATDAAATAGAIEINPVTGSQADVACQTAWEYLLINIEDEGSPGTLPNCSTFASVCDPVTARQTTATAGDFSFVITHPVPDAHPFMSGQSINTDVDGAPCQRLGVSIERTRDYLLAPVLGFTSGTPEAASVGRIAIRPGEGELVPLLLLEPISCDALVASGQGAVTVDYFEDVPGIIVVDSNASKSSNPNRCGNNRYSIDANDNALNWIRALPVPDSATPPNVDVPSAILSYALSGVPPADPTHAYDPADVTGAINPNPDPPVTWFRVYPEPIPTTRRITRAPIDWRYNCKTVYPDYPLDLSNPGVGFPIDPCPDPPAPHIDNLRSPGQYGGNVGTSPIGIAQRWTSTYPCTIDPITWPSGVILESGSWWVDCPGGLVIENTIVTIDSGDVVLDGDIDLRSFGELHINPTNASDHVVYLRNGDLKKGAQSTLKMNRVFVYIEDTGVVDLGGGAGADSLVWVAPEGGNFEDLALWAEAPLVFQIGGQAGNTLTGTFFTPLADPFTLTGQGGQFQTNAQFLTRRLEVKGQGEVKMIPDPDRSTRIPIRGVMLIR